MSNATVVVPEGLVEKIKREAEETYPEECCGILIGTANGTEKNVFRLYGTQNVHSDNKERRFMISPADFKKAEQVARDADAEIIGFYHSHPDHPAVPSEHDREYAWPWYLYLIVSVENGKSSAIEGWELRDDRKSYEKIAITIS